MDTSLSPFKLGEKCYLTLIRRDATIRQRAEQKLEQSQQENARLQAVVHSEEREHILEALQLTDWKVSGPQGAAKLLGVKPTTLNARMSKPGIVRPR